MSHRPTLASARPRFDADGIKSQQDQPPPRHQHAHQHLPCLPAAQPPPRQTPLPLAAARESAKVPLSMLALIYTGLQANPGALRLTGILLGLILLLVHGTALIRPGQSLALARQFPRHRTAGIVLLAIAAIWSWGLLRGLDLGPLRIPRMILGEFSWVRQPLLMLLPICFFLVAFFAEEFLAVRALGCLLFLTASLILDIAWMRFDIHLTRQLLPWYCYLVLIIPSLFLVGQPWRLRDLLTWFEQRPQAWRAALSLGAAFGLTLLVSALLWWK